MKKIFFFAAAALAALSVNARVWEFTTDTLNSVAAVNAYSSTATTFSLADKTSSDGKPYVSVDYSLTESAVASLNMDKAPIPIKFTYKNSSAKTECLKFYKTYLQIGRKGVIMTIPSKAGEVIKIYPKSYTKACEFSVTGANLSTVAIEANSEEVIELTAIASEVILNTSSPSSDSYAQSCQIVKIETSGSQGINDVNANTKAEKFFRDGQLIIRKNGVEYNALGVQL